MSIQFTSINSRDSGINHISDNLPGPPMGGNNPGAAASDYDNDGWVDLYVTRRNAPDILYRNNGDGTFTDVTLSSGINRVTDSNGAAFADIDNDGDQDLYVTTAKNERYYLYINNGKGFFEEQAIPRNVALNINNEDILQRTRFGNGIAFGDYDKDGYLDIHANEWDSPEHFNTRLLRNLGDFQPGYFEDTTEAAGVDVPNVFAFASHFTDLDSDGYQDLVISGDYATSKLFWNNGDGTFTDGTTDAGVGTDENGMGLTVGDYDGDGKLDIFITSIYYENGTPYDLFPDLPYDYDFWLGDTGNRLFRNEGNRTFSDQTDAVGVRDGGWGWGTNFFDFDNDGDLDLAMTNGFILNHLPDDYDNPHLDDPMRLWRNDNGFFTEIATSSGVTDTGLGQGLLTFDYDNDGDLDMFVTNNGSDPLLYRNDSENTNDWLKVKTQGTVSNADGVGAVVTVVATEDGPEQIREISASSDYLGQSEITAHFGLGDLPNDLVHQVRIQWPSGIIQEFDNVSANQMLTIVESGF
ncbi:hypothetical protein Xen7305DRAFT_00025450 [Xenococcus sp. PCC 7305]|uniref:CRTAC1 family protein n=1 Tax=Xenococcus sp. PCC 7305 TaxID=102125 RepID=UPI0002ACE9B1|nr:CRTAC1 family protein [Xenococcus sp. PCC 7305]ELS02827.1 hypothetical protein Xen7305DRAFT_00025450 [Xenococcus sp. PCC 7305]